jgi:predicted dinucleotide-binding enzyme
MLSMKKITVILVALLLICTMSPLSFAQTSQGRGVKKAAVNTEIIRGKIISINTAKNEIVVKENKTGTEKTIVVDPTVISSLKVDEDVKVALKAGSNVAEKVNKIVKKTTSTKK